MAIALLLHDGTTFKARSSFFGRLTTILTVIATGSFTDSPLASATPIKHPVVALDRLHILNGDALRNFLNFGIGLRSACRA